MSRIAVPLKCKEDEINALNEILNSSIYNDNIKRRANIILLANSGMSNKEIAVEVNSNENTVAVWRNRFSKDRLVGLSDLERPGRRGSGENKRSAVIKAARNNDEATVRQLAEDACTSQSTARRALNDAGIITGNKRTYEINACSELNKVCADIKGIYVSGNALAMVLRIDGTLSPVLDKGTASSRNRVLALSTGDNSTLTEVLDLMCTKKKESAVREVGLDEFLKKTDGSLDGEARHVAVVYSGRHALPQGFIPKNMTLLSMRDAESWQSCVLTCLTLLSVGNEGKRIFHSLDRYIKSRTDNEEAFVWTRKMLPFVRSAREDAINPKEISAMFEDPSVSNIAWVKYGYATKDGEYAEFIDTMENILPERDGAIHGDPLKIASYTGEVVDGVRKLFSQSQRKLAEEYMNNDGGKKNGFVK